MTDGCMTSAAASSSRPQASTEKRATEDNVVN